MDRVTIGLAMNLPSRHQPCTLALDFDRALIRFLCREYRASIDICALLPLHVRALDYYKILHTAARQKCNHSQTNSVDDHEDEDVSLGDISQDEIDGLNKDPEYEVRSATSVQNNDNENDDEAELTPEDKQPSVYACLAS